MMCCNRTRTCCGSNDEEYPFYLPVSQSDLARLAELSEALEVIQNLRNGTSNSCGCSCSNSCCG
jgi:hypothetical protein